MVETTYMKKCDDCGSAAEINYYWQRGEKSVALCLPCMINLHENLTEDIADEEKRRGGKCKCK